jgi:hypothetical protein
MLSMISVCMRNCSSNALQHVVCSSSSQVSTKQAGVAQQDNGLTACIQQIAAAKCSTITAQQQLVDSEAP